MARIRLETADNQWLDRIFWPRHKDRCNRAGFNRIAKGRPRAMCLDDCHLHHRRSRICKRCTQHALLRLPIRRREACASSILTNRAAIDLRKRRAIQTAGQAASQRVDRLAASIAIRSGIKRVRTATSGREAGCCVAPHRSWIEDHVDAGTQTSRALGPLKRSHVAVVGH